jgi:peptide/nickel transport system permease protein
MIEGYTRAINGKVKLTKRKKMAFISEETIEWNQQQLKSKLILLKNDMTTSK